MMNNTYKRGFTLIELLVVIAIIGILASVVLASLNQARDKGTDAAIQSSVSNLRAQAEIVGNQANGTVDYSTVCADPQVDKIEAEVLAKSGTASACADATGTWGFAAPLKQGGYVCVDSTGNSKTYTAAQAALVAHTVDIADGADYTCDGV